MRGSVWFTLCYWLQQPAVFDYCHIHSVRPDKSSGLRSLSAAGEVSLCFKNGCPRVYNLLPSYTLSTGLIIQRDRTKILETCMVLLSKDTMLSCVASVVEPGDIWNCDVL